MQLKNDLLIRAAKGEKVERTPVWLMRQAGRILPEYRAVRESVSGFIELAQTPELAAEVTIQPVDILDVDAAIIFSDILVIPEAMGLPYEMVEKRGPWFPQTVQSESDLKKLRIADGANDLSYVIKAIEITKKELAGRVPLIGFAGAPWTILCYMVEGKGSKTWDKAKQFAYTQPAMAHQLLQKITDITIVYLKHQVKAGADTVQVFDSWAGSLSPADFKLYAQPYLFQIAEALKDDAPVILFPKGTWHALKEISESAASGVGIDWCITAQMAREFTQNKITIQGNFDPAKLLAPISEIKKAVKEMIDAFGTQRYIANLGHGITPNVPVDHARAFVDAVKEYGPL